jgi:hypothetical protein
MFYFTVDVYEWLYYNSFGQKHFIFRYKNVPDKLGRYPGRNFSYNLSKFLNSEATVASIQQVK